MNTTYPLPDTLIQLIAQRFRVLSDPTRIKLLDRLREGESSVHELTELIGSSPQNVSKHLGVLHLAGIVHRRKAGNYVYYSIADAGVFALCEAVCGSLRERLDALSSLVAGASEANGR